MDAPARTCPTFSTHPSPKKFTILSIRFAPKRLELLWFRIVYDNFAQIRLYTYTGTDLVDTKKYITFTSVKKRGIERRRKSAPIEGKSCATSTSVVDDL